MVSIVDVNNTFSFESISTDDISLQIKRLEINSDIPTKPVQNFDNLIVDYLQETFNICL